MKYENKRNGAVVEFVRQDNKRQEVIVKTADGKINPISISTWKRWWKKIEDSSKAEEPKLVPMPVNPSGAEEHAKREVAKQTNPVVPNENVVAVVNVVNAFASTNQFSVITKDNKLFTVKNGKKSLAEVYVGKKDIHVYTKSAFVQGKFPYKTIKYTMDASITLGYGDTEMLKEILSCSLS